MQSLEKIAAMTEKAALELLRAASLKAGQTVIVGCSTSEIVGAHIGTASNVDVGTVVFGALHKIFSINGINLAAQCCEHLNRAIVLERETAAGTEQVNALPKPNAGGSFACAAYTAFFDPVLVEEIRADAGLDIGGTLIGMHLKRVAVPLRLKTTHIGLASISAARTRPRLIGGVRTVYDERIQ